MPLQLSVRIVGIACAVTLLLTACSLERLSGAPGPAHTPPPDAPAGFRAELGPAIWALERVSSDGTSVWIRVAEGDCAKFHHAKVEEVPGGLRIAVTNRVLIPVRKDYGCLLYLRAARVSVELPRRLEDDRILGACRSGEETPAQRICALMEQAGGSQRR